MQTSALLVEIAVHLLDKSTFTEDNNAVARLQLSVAVDECSLTILTDVSA